MKWNSNINLMTMWHDPNKKFYGNLFGKVIVDQELDFPDDENVIKEIIKPQKIEEFYPELRNPNKNRLPLEYVEGQHLSREFFSGHRSTIVFLCHIENSKDLLSIDEQGHVFVWQYDLKFCNEDFFTPSHKYRIPLEYRKMECVQQKETSSPASNEGYKDAQAVYQRSLDHRELLHGNGNHKYILPSRMAPIVQPDGVEARKMHEVIFSSTKDFLV